jgi:trk system potassium uptake protein TrkA
MEKKEIFTMEAKRSLSGREKFAYGIGAVGKDMVYMLSASYISIYFLDVMGISAAAIAVLLMAARVFDAFNDPIIAGGGKISYYLAKSLLMSGIKTTIIEINQQRCEFLSEQLPKATILCGDATDKELLSEECIEKAAGFAALTDLDEENILLSLYANGISSAKTVTKVNRINFTSVINKLDLGSIIYPRVITAEYIIKYVRSMNNSLNSNVEALYKLEDGKAEVLEFLLKENSAVCNIPLQNLKIRKNTLICCIYRNHQVIVPSGQDCMMPGDSVMIATSGYNISDIKEILED